MLDRELSNNLSGRIPIVPHETIAGVECCGCIVAEVEGTNVELRCECGSVVGVVQLEIIKGLLGLDYARTACPHCGRVHMFAGLTAMKSYTCHGCGKAVKPSESDSDLDPKKWIVRTLRRPPAEPEPQP